MTSIHDLFQEIKKHPDFRFGVIFATEDVEDGGYDWNDQDEKYGEEHLTRAGFEYLDVCAGTFA